MNIKVLSLADWMTNPLINKEKEGCLRVTPIYNRNGWYYDKHNNKCWFEVDNKAWTSNYLDESFISTLNLLNTPCITMQQFAALEVLDKSGLISKEQYHILENYRYKKWILHMKVDIRRRLIQFPKNIKEANNAYSI